MQQKKEKEKKKKKRFIPKKPVDCIYNFETKSYYNSQQYYFQSLVFLVFHVFLCWNADAGTCQKRSFMHLSLAYYQTCL